jgi:hypothetical protein
MCDRPLWDFLHGVHLCKIFVSIYGIHQHCKSVLYDTHGAGQAYYGLINGKKIKSAGSCKIRMDILWNVGEFYLFIFFV